MEYEAEMRVKELREVLISVALQTAHTIKHSIHLDLSVSPYFGILVSEERCKALGCDGPLMIKLPRALLL